MVHRRPDSPNRPAPARLVRICLGRRGLGLRMQNKVGSAHLLFHLFVISTAVAGRRCTPNCLCRRVAYPAEARADQPNQACESVIGPALTRRFARPFKVPGMCVKTDASASVSERLWKEGLYCTIHGTTTSAGWARIQRVSEEVRDNVVLSRA